jgi:hypothetical protein
VYRATAAQAQRLQPEDRVHVSGTLRSNERRRTVDGEEVVDRFVNLSARDILPLDVATEKHLRGEAKARRVDKPEKAGQEGFDPRRSRILDDLERERQAAEKRRAATV